MLKESGEGRRRAAESAPELDSKREQCPRCESHDTKFCYYNNYNTSQPRHFCKACRRYWTLGGSLRNVPIGGSSRKRLRTAASAAKASCGAVHGSVGSSALEIPVGGFGSFLAEPLLALGEPFLEGRAGFELGLGLGLGSWAGPASPGMDELGLSFGLGTTQLLWPTALLEEEGGDTWKMRSGGGECFAAPSAAIWQDLAVSSSAEGNSGPGARLA
ncbi:uncharacterized protein [Typha latifolia]|uniref:uncharacterized protein n=1 Tax=Typha latifolia TaxID=4733 RepID=UPI003C30D6CD